MGKKSRLKKERQQLKPQKTAQTFDKRNVVIFLLVLVILTGLLYWRSLYNDFVNLDDNEHVYKNPVIRSLAWDNIKEMFTGARMGNWIPLTQISFALDYHFGGLEPFGYHLTNLLLHILNTLLVFWLFLLLSRNAVFAFLVGLMFSFHPLHVESVAWITERKDVLYAFFYLISMISWYFWRKKGKWGFLIITYLGFILALLSKSMAVTLPVVLIIVDHYYFSKPVKKVIADKAVFFLLALGAVIITWKATYSTTAVYTQLNIFERLLMANYAFWFYPFKLLFPFRLSAIYPYPQDINQALPTYYYLLPLLTAGLIMVIRKVKNELVHFGFWLYFIMILPVLQLLPLAGSSLTCDRFTYLPGIGIFLVILAIFKFKTQYWVIGVLCVFWAVLSWLRIGVWENGIILHSDIIAKYPEVELPYINRGKAYGEQGEHGKAIADFSSAIKVKPGSADAYNNRGNEYSDLKDFEMAIADLSKAIELRPDFTEAYNNRGHAYMGAGQNEAAEADFTQAVKLKPEYASGWYNRGNLYRQTGRYEAAIADYDQALKLDAGMTEAYNNRGTAKTMAQKYQEAIRDFGKALELEPGNVSFLNNRGNAYKDMGNSNLAIADFNEAIRLQPGYSNAYHNRAVVYYEAGNYEQARRDIEQVKRLKGYVNPAFEQALQKAEEKELSTAD